MFGPGPCGDIPAIEDLGTRGKHMQLIVLPGIGGSGRAHWQSLWQADDPSIRRFRPADWDQPDLSDWIAALDREVERSSEPPILVAHSLACLLVSHWAARSRHSVAGAFLVAVPDPLSSVFPAEARGFAAVPPGPLPFPSLVVASTNDPYGSMESIEARAADWGSRVLVAGPLGHINGQSGLGDWPAGRALLADFAAAVSGRASVTGAADNLPAY
jgi:predicted alpha/beta hydrolase family esterase